MNSDSEHSASPSLPEHASTARVSKHATPRQALQHILTCVQLAQLGARFDLARCEQLIESTLANDKEPQHG